MRFYFGIRDKLAIRDEVGRDLETVSEAIVYAKYWQPTSVAWNATPGLDCPLRSLARAISESTRKLSSLRPSDQFEIAHGL
jgi:hypothetical protein